MVIYNPLRVLRTGAVACRGGLRLRRKALSPPRQRVYFTAMNRRELLDLYFLEARAKVVDLAAFLDRVRRAEGETDFRYQALKQAFTELLRDDPECARRVLLSFSDPTTEPIAKATVKGACGAWPGKG